MQVKLITPDGHITGTHRIARGDVKYPAGTQVATITVYNEDAVKVSGDYLTVVNRDHVVFEGMEEVL